jgi:hypothetical protein
MVASEALSSSDQHDCGIAATVEVEMLMQAAVNAVQSSRHVNNRNWL